MDKREQQIAKIIYEHRNDPGHWYPNEDKYLIIAKEILPLFAKEEEIIKKWGNWDVDDFAYVYNEWQILKKPIEGFEMEWICPECDEGLIPDYPIDFGDGPEPQVQICTNCKGINKRSRPLTWGDVEFNKRPWLTIDRSGDSIEKHLWDIKQYLIKEGWKIKEGK